jgi:hypothetical protein
MLFCHTLNYDLLILALYLANQAVEFRKHNVTPTEQFEAYSDSYKANSDLFDSECDDFLELDENITKVVRKKLKY